MSEEKKGDEIVILQQQRVKTSVVSIRDADKELVQHSLGYS